MYQSPLHIVPGNQLIEARHLDLKLLRKELLLRLELSGNTTLRINDREYDRNAILMAVDHLKEDFDVHLHLFRNKPLLNFVEKGALDFFEEPEAWEDLEEPVFQLWLKPHFSKQYSHILYKCASERSYHSINDLQTIFETGFRLPPAYRDSCNQKTYGYFKTLIKEARRNYRMPFDRQRRKMVIDPGVEQYINLHHYNVFRLLGDDFEPVIYEFGAYCRDLLVQAFPRETRLETLSRPTLHTLHHAAKITLLTTNDHSIANLSRTLGRYLASRVVPAQETSWGNWTRILFILAYLAFFLISGINSCNRSSSDDELDIRSITLNEKLKEVNLPLNPEDLVGQWRAELMLADSSTIAHFWTFEEDGQGRSVYALPLTSDGETCNYVFHFSWELTSSVNNQRRFNQLNLTLTRADEAGTCAPMSISPAAETLYVSLEDIGRYGPYRQNFYLIRELNVLLSGKQQFRLRSNGRVYHKLDEVQ